MCGDISTDPFDDAFLAVIPKCTLTINNAMCVFLYREEKGNTKKGKKSKTEKIKVREWSLYFSRRCRFYH